MILRPGELANDKPGLRLMLAPIVPGISYGASTFSIPTNGDSSASGNGRMASEKGELAAGSGFAVAMNDRVVLIRLSVVGDH